MKRLLLISGALLLLTASRMLGAEIGTGTLTVTASVPATCSITSATVPFGSLTSFSSNNDHTGSMSVTCTNLLHGATMSADLGGNASGSTRRMQDGSTGHYIEYELFTDSGYTNIWNTTTNLLTLPDGTGSAQTVNVYGRVHSGQTPPPGNSYTDTVNLTVNF